MSIIVTGGAGFIGSNFLHKAIEWFDDEIICLDNLTYAGTLQNVPNNISFYKVDISNKEECESIFKSHKPKTIFHFAAESHVDNSIKNCLPFITSNINGTVNLLNLSLEYEIEKFIHISTDEVYGSILDGSFTEESNYNPQNPYSASKSASDHFVMAYHNTYGLPVNITNCSNNYGPRQHKEKLIPKAIFKLMNGEKVPVYGRGDQIRDWLYVEDHCEALYEVWKKGKIGQKYNIGGECEISNYELVTRICNYFNFDQSMIEFIDDRPGHDFRYSTDISKIKTELGWNPKFSFENGIEKTIKWYENNRNKS
jgi:dTDP-glucose 4,6-dehydratase